MKIISKLALPFPLYINKSEGGEGNNINIKTQTLAINANFYARNIYAN